MEVKTKYNVGDTIYFVDDDILVRIDERNIHQSVINKINISIINNEYVINYYVNHITNSEYKLTENECFSNKEEIIKISRNHKFNIGDIVKNEKIGNKKMRSKNITHRFKKYLEKNKAPRFKKYLEKNKVNFEYIFEFNHRFTIDGIDHIVYTRHLETVWTNEVYKDYECNDDILYNQFVFPHIVNEIAEEIESFKEYYGVDGVVHIFSLMEFHEPPNERRDGPLVHYMIRRKILEMI